MISWGTELVVKELAGLCCYQALSAAGQEIERVADGAEAKQDDLPYRGCVGRVAAAREGDNGAHTRAVLREQGA